MNSIEIDKNSLSKSSSLHPHNVLIDLSLDRLTRLASNSVKAPISFISFVEGNRQIFKSCIGLPEPLSTIKELPLSQSFCKHVMTTGKPLIISDVQLEPLVQDIPEIEEFSITAYAGFPITTSDGFELGVFCVIDSKSRQWTHEELSILTDLTNSLITEIELRNELQECSMSKAKLTESENRYRLLSELMSDYAFSGSFGSDGGVKNDWITESAFERVTGYTITEATTLSDIPTELKDYLETTIADVHRVKTGQTTSNQYCIKTKQKELRWLQVDHYPKWNDTKDSVIGFYGIAHDVTESRLAQEREQQLIAEEERTRVLRQCVNNISHDFRTPLSILQTNLYLLKHDIDTANQENRLGIMEKQIIRLSQLIENMLLMSRLDNSSEWSFRPLHINEVITIAYAQTSKQASKKGIELVLQLAENLKSIRADTIYLHLAIKHLIENAVQFTPPDGRVIVRTYSDIDEVICEVEDTGIGIDEHDLPHLFEHFFRADSARSNDGGGGIGLTITQRVITAHSGSIEVESAVNQGSIFRLRLPILPNHALRSHKVS